MRVRRVAYLAASMLFFAAAFLAQDSRKDERDPYQFEVKPAKLPDGYGVWSVQMVRSGGFAGRVITASLTSDGKMACLSCEGGNASKQLSKESLLEIAPSFYPQTALAGNSVVKVVKPGDVVTLAPSVLCRDCFVTRVTIQHRDSNGKVQTYFAYWDDTTAVRVPTELVKLASGMASLAK